MTEQQEFPIPFGKYLLTELIAVGGMAEVYKAKIFGASGFEKEMVVKRILPRYAKNPSFVQMLIDEAKIAVRLTHGNIVPIYELGELDGAYFIAMEYVDGLTLLDLLRSAHSADKKIPTPHCLHLIAEAASGLAYAHGQKAADGTPLGLVHRDINPRNIVVTKSGEVKILDFGIARASTKKHQTKSGVIKGTPGYMSPEQLYGHSIDHRTDIYCLGILAWELVTLSRLFPVWTIKEMRTLFERNPIRAPSQVVPGLDPKVDAVIMRALTKLPEERFQHADEFEAELRLALAGLGTAVTAGSIARMLSETQAPTEASTSTRPPTPAPISLPIDPAASSQAASSQAASSQAASPQAASSPAVAAPSTEAIAAQPVDEAAQAPSFVIALDDANTGEFQPLEPLQRPKDGAYAPHTQVLAQNEALDWAARIGDDAELLALGRSIGADPRRRGRLVKALGMVMVIGLAVLVATNARSIWTTASRAVAGKKVRPGAMIIKTKPSGAEVIVDGQVRGKSSIKLTGIDPDVTHHLVVKLQDGRVIDRQVRPADFNPGGGLPVFLLEQDLDKELVIPVADAGVADAGATPKAASKKKVTKRRSTVKSKSKGRKHRSRRGKHKKRRGH